MYSFPWLAVFAAALVVESATLSLTAVWFAVGAVFAFISVYAGAALSVQLGVFITGCILSLAFLRPVCKKFFVIKHERTNADRVLGGRAIVISEISNLKPTGQIKTSCGQLWTAISENGEDIPAGEVVEIVKISGVKVVCRKTDEGLG